MPKPKAIEELGYGDSRLASGHSAFGHGESHHQFPRGVRRDKNGNRKPMRFNSLHHHTTFSYGDGYQLPEVHARRAAELLISSIAFTEHGNVSSHVKAEVACLKYGVKPIFGCEVYMVEDLEHNSQKKYHLTILALNQVGYANLLALVSASFTEGFYHEPTVDFRLLERYREGLVILSGCQGSLLHCSAVGGKLIDERDAGFGRAFSVARKFKRIFGENYFIEVQGFPELEKARLFAPIAERIARLLKIQLVGSLDIHYTAPEENEIQKILHNVRPGEKRTLEDLERDWGYEVPLCPPLSDMAFLRRLRRTGLSFAAAQEAWLNTELIANACNVTLPKLPMPRYPLPRGYESAGELMRAWLREGWRYRGLHKLSWPEREKYKKRLAYELGIIEQKDFLDYFLIVSDNIKWLKGQKCPVGPARGSAAASLICWLLRITEVDPLLFPNLVFERFIDISREDLPDIDLDMPEWGRAMLREYNIGKYGEDCVANIGTFTYYKAKLALDDVARVHRIPRPTVEAFKELLVERSSGDLRASATIMDTAEHFDAAAKIMKDHPHLAKAGDLEGNVKDSAVHAAGMVVSTGDIRQVAALYSRYVGKNKELMQVVSMDKYDAERQGLLKLDYLALSTLDMIQMALDEIGMSLEELYAIPLEEPEIIQGFRENDCVGIFQFDGRAARSVNQALKPDTFDEIADVIALCRPGPLHSGATGDYIETKHGRKERESLHPVLDAITQATQGQIVYQEQILRVVTSVGNFDWTSASAIRRIMSKKEGSSKFNQAWASFWKGAKTYHERHPNEPVIDEELARYVWNRLITAGAYAFNFAHCVSYGMLGCWAMWIKRHHPEVFYAAALAKLPEGKNKTPTQWEALKQDTLRKGIELLPPRASAPTETWTSGDGFIRAGLIQIPNIAEKSAKPMIEFAAANKNKRLKWDDYRAVKGIGPVTIEKIHEMVNSDDPFGVEELNRKLEAIREDLEKLGLPYTTHMASEIPYEKGANEEVVWLGIVTKRNLKDIFEAHRAKTGEELDPKEVKQPELREQVVFTCYDGTEVCTVRFDRWKYPRFKKAIWSINPDEDVILVRGVKPGWRTAREIYARDLWVLQP
jgi:DNA polymerase-3 subunit alpha